MANNNTRPLQLNYLDSITRGNNPGYQGSRTNLTNEQMASINAAIAQDPEWLRAQGTQGPGAINAYRAAFERAYGAPLDSIGNLDDYTVDGASGQIQQRSWVNRHPAAFATLFGLGAAGAGAALSAGGGAGGGAATGGTAAGTGATAAGGTAAATGGTAAATGGTAAGTTAAGGAATAGSRFAQLAQAGGRAASAYGQAQSQNRGTQLQATMDQDQTRLAAERDRRAGEREAMAGLARTNYIQNWQPRTSSVQGLPTYGFGPQAPSEAQRRGAATLEQTLLDRLDTGGFQPSDTSSLMQPSRGERFAGLLGAGLSAYGAYSGNRGASAVGNAVTGATSGRGGSGSTTSSGAPATPQSQASGTSPSSIFQDQSGMDRWNNAINAGRQNIPVTESMQVPVVDESLVMPVQNSYRDDIFADQSGMGRWDEILRRSRGGR